MIHPAMNHGPGAKGHLPASDYASIRKSRGMKLQDPIKVGPGMINPFTWNREHQIELLVAALI
jgi:hypothetical protein